MAKTMKYIVDVLVTRYEQLLAQAESKGISVWDKKAELVKLKKLLGEIKEPEAVVVEVAKVKVSRKVKETFVAEPSTPKREYDAWAHPAPTYPYPDPEEEQPK